MQDTHELFSVDLEEQPAAPWKTPLQAAGGDGDVLGVIAVP